MRTGSGRIINSSFKFNTYPAAKLPVEIGQPRHRLKLAIKQETPNKHPSRTIYKKSSKPHEAGPKHQSVFQRQRIPTSLRTVRRFPFDSGDLCGVFWRGGSSHSHRPWRAHCRAGCGDDLVSHSIQAVLVGTAWAIYLKCFLALPSGLNLSSLILENKSNFVYGQ